MLTGKYILKYDFEQDEETTNNNINNKKQYNNNNIKLRNEKVEKVFLLYKKIIIYIQR